MAKNTETKVNTEVVEEKGFNQKAFIDNLAENMGTTKKVAGEAYHAFLATLTEAVANEGEVRLTGVGTFSVKDVDARTARNPKTGEAVEVPAKKKVLFKVSSSLKKFVNGEE